MSDALGAALVFGLLMLLFGVLCAVVIRAGNQSAREAHEHLRWAEEGYERQRCLFDQGRVLADKPPLFSGPLTEELARQRREYDENNIADGRSPLFSEEDKTYPPTPALTTTRRKRKR